MISEGVMRRLLVGSRSGSRGWPAGSPRRGWRCPALLAGTDTRRALPPPRGQAGACSPRADRTARASHRGGSWARGTDRGPGPGDGRGGRRWPRSGRPTPGSAPRGRGERGARRRVAGPCPATAGRARARRRARWRRRDAREHVIGGEEQVVHLEADLARAVPGRVVHAIAVDDLLAVLHHAVDGYRLEGGLGEAIHRLELAPELTGEPGALQEDAH